MGETIPRSALMSASSEALALYITGQSIMESLGVWTDEESESVVVVEALSSDGDSPDAADREPFFDELERTWGNSPPSS